MTGLALHRPGPRRYNGPMKTALRSASIAVLFAATIGAQSPPPPGAGPRTKIDVSKLGPQVGERVPDFSLKDQDGNAQTLRSIMGPRGAMLVFIRSADW